MWLHENDTESFDFQDATGSRKWWRSRSSCFLLGALHHVIAFGLKKELRLPMISERNRGRYSLKNALNILSKIPMIFQHFSNLLLCYMLQMLLLVFDRSVYLLISLLSVFSEVWKWEAFKETPKKLSSVEKNNLHSRHTNSI